MSENSKNEGGFGIGVILFLIFLVLKLGGWGVVATWSWWWVTAPFWLPTLVILGLLLVFAIIALMANSGRRR